MPKRRRVSPVNKRLVRRVTVERVDDDDAAFEILTSHLEGNHLGNARRDPRLERCSVLGPPVDNIDPETKLLLKEQHRLHEVVGLHGTRRDGVLGLRDRLEAEMGFNIDPPDGRVTMEA